jgi:hypothetical protein
MFYESYADQNIQWRSGARKIVVNFGNSIPHDDNLYNGYSSTSTWNTGGDPGRDGIMGNDDDLDLQEVLQGMVDSNVVLIEMHGPRSGTIYANERPLWDYWTGITGGTKCIVTPGNAVLLTVNEVSTFLSTSTINDLHLVAEPGFEDWLVETSPMSYSGVTGVIVPFDATISVPEGTEAGTYEFTIDALDSHSVSYGRQVVRIDVPDPNNTPINTTVDYTGEMLVLDVNPVTLSAVVTPKENEMPGDLTKINVEFSLFKTNSDGAVTLERTLNTYCDADGVATLSEVLPVGVYTVKTTAFGNGYFTDASTESMLVVYNPDGGFATGGGYINVTDLADGDLGRANFGFNAKYKSAVATGHLEFQYKDGGIDMKSQSIDWLVISSVSAQFEGTATIKGRSGEFKFRVNCTDGGDKADKFTIKIWNANGELVYKALNQDLAGGNIKVHTK